MSKDSLGDRMKKMEDSFRINLPIRMPVILRVDGKSFHSYTKGCKKPVDDALVKCMNDTAKELCKNIQGVQIAYIQSDEISLLLNNYHSKETQPWFGNTLQKMVSISSAIASVTFTNNSSKIFGVTKSAYFDSRAFVLPKEEVNNYFYWRMQDSTRNSVQMLARSLYSHKELNNKNNSELQEMCWQKGFNWNDCPTSQKRGRCIVKQKIIRDAINPITREISDCERSEWIVDNEIPIFSQDKNYIEKYL